MDLSVIARVARRGMFLCRVAAVGLFGVASAAWIAGFPAKAVEEGGRTIPGLVGLLKLSGKCLRVSLARQDLTAACTGYLNIAVYADRRAGFHVTMGKGHVLTVSGVHPAGDTGNAVTVDRVVLNDGIEANKPQVFTANGRCAYGNPYVGKMTLRCTGTFGKSTDFTLAFETDGKPPAEQ